MSLLSACILGCGPQPEEETALCDCVQNEAGEFMMYLSLACQERIKQKFGANLDGMETWFRDHCDYSTKRPPVAKPSTKESKS